MTINFKITNGKPLSNEKYEAIKKDYLNNKLTVKQIMKKHNLTQAKMLQIRRRFKDDKIPLRHKKKPQIEKNITENYELIKKDYIKQELSVPQIKEKYNLSYCAWDKVIKRFKHDKVPLRRGRIVFKKK